MALKTLGTSATTTLNALVMNSDLTVADAATLRANIKWDYVYVNGAWVQNQNGAAYPGGFEFQGGSGLLYVPRRGVLQVLPGDYVAYDPNGWPILVAGGSITTNVGSATGWAHS